MPNSQSPQPIIERLAAQADEVAWVVANFPADSAHLDPERREPAQIEEGSWSLHVTLCHMAVVESDLYLPRLVALTEVPSLTFQPLDARALLHQYVASEPALEAVLARYLAARGEIVKALRAVGPAAWAHRATHATFGEHTLDWWAFYTYWHTLDHLTQIAMARRALTV